ncbi:MULTISPECIES: sensor histidine kinase [unclassified Bacillus (in: firmicutes)]|uniref:ATP-binding protein n=1 Tax=unclassified Bacillus (in: firmicutes) TaxID=185979 RepID=UPI002035C14C|nr:MULTISPECIES: sensor histidine kinase [unclassified Bacillus (in: firmicutes)]
MGKRTKKPRLLTQMVVFFSTIILITIVSVSALFSMMIDDMIKTSLGNQAMAVAKMTSQKEHIINAFKDPNPSLTIQPIAEGIRKSTGAGYVVIGNKENIRYSHQIPKYIGKPMGSSNKQVFENNASIIYEGTGISGKAIKAKTPIYNKDGEIIGVSSVGFLTSEVEGKVHSYRLKLLQFSIFILLFGITGAVIISKRVKKLIFNLEPEEISFLFKEKEATLESIRDATVAVNIDGEVTSINKRARELLKHDEIEKGMRIKHSRLYALIESVMGSQQNVINQKVIFGDQLNLVDASPILEKQRTRGAVLTIRPVSEIEEIIDEISKVQNVSDHIRAQNHEYLNRLNTIYGLITLEQYDEARELISEEVKERQDIVVFLTSSVKDPFIAACLLGKINRSKELKVELEIDKDSNLEDIPSTLNTKLFVSILGNLIDNAMEAAVRAHSNGANVKVSFTDIGSDIIFDIEDNGKGIPEEWQEMIFIQGFTTKEGENHGLGLAIVKNALKKLDGEIFISTSDSGGAQFTIVLPKGN